MTLIHKFGSKKASEAVPILIEQLKANDAVIRSNAASNLGDIAKEAVSAVPALTVALKDKNLQVNSSVTLALSAIGKEVPSTVVPALTKALQKDQDGTVRSSAAKVLGDIGQEVPSTTASIIPRLIEALQKDKNETVRSNAADALGGIGQKVSSTTALIVPRLIEVLQKDKNETVRSNVANALGGIGFSARSAMPILIQILQDIDTKNDPTSVVDPTSFILSIGSLAESYQDNVSKLSNEDIDIAIFNLEKALKILAKDNSKEKFANEYKAPISRSLYFLKKEKDSRLLARTLDLISKYPWLIGAIIYIIFFPSLWFTLLWLRPILLLKINNVLKILTVFKLPDVLGGGTLPIQTLLFLEPFTYLPRVLDAWVAVHIDSAKEGFSKKKMVSERSIYVPIPVILDNNAIANFTGKDLLPIFEKQRSTLLIFGEGGAGKTSLACQLAKWAMFDESTERISKHRMIPVLIEQEIDFDVVAGEQALTKTIAGQLQALLGEAEPISQKLLECLLRQQRILVIVDHLSEMSQVTRKEIRPADPNFLANALIITSRLDETLDNVPKTTIKPLRVEGNNLSSFMEAYLTYRGKRHLFNDAEYFDACRRLSLMVGQRNTTVLLAKLYAEQMIATKQGLADNLPNNIPDLMLAYINELNRGATNNEPDNRTIQRDAKLVAWECLKQTFRPTSANRDLILAVLPDQDTALERLEHLEKRLYLIQVIGSAQDKIRFTLDPLAEYLAGLHLIGYYKNDEASWRNFLAQTDSIKDVEVIKGFLLAIRDCCLALGQELGVPNFVVSELDKRTGLATQPTGQSQTLSS
ncbi:hypothetical protein A6770_36805 [Nostoc minutum NIES-26]|uniref:NACHT domain-containing protein n=1 Tax=Nostoc minutum NIES-26 TaxID=1844469 RepID=A0A367RWH7_9NOSO|nr:hypothetical protein A6770_36805 [Nostoc minutum NIES-26]